MEADAQARAELWRSLGALQRLLSGSDETSRAVQRSGDISRQTAPHVEGRRTPCGCCVGCIREWQDAVQGIVRPLRRYDGRSLGQYLQSQRSGHDDLQMVGTVPDHPIPKRVVQQYKLRRDS